MITKEELKKEIYLIPENLLDRTYFSIKKVILQRKIVVSPRQEPENIWRKWEESIDKFTPDFMQNSEHPSKQI